MIKIEKVLLARRTTDGLFLKLHETAHCTSYDHVAKPEIATRTHPLNNSQLINPEKAPYYFENSDRARESWVKDCVMVPYEITTEVTAKII